MINSSTSQQLSVRHKQVLDTAMALIAERGLKAASLRELARRLEMSQPSLYHYFSSKDDLVGQIITHYSARTMSSVPILPRIETLRHLLTLCLEFIRDIYATDEHVTWIRFLFAVTMERPEFGGILRASFIERGMELAELLGAPCVAAGDVTPEDLRPALELAAGALTMRLLERRVMGTATPIEGAAGNDAFIDFVVDAVARGARHRAQHREKDGS